MSKKFITLILILTSLVGNVVNIHPPAAKAAPVNLDEYWSFGEILEFKNEIEAAARATCGDTVICKRDYLYEKQRENPLDYRYLLVEHLYDVHFYVTAIDPYRETITIYYDEEDHMEWEMGYVGHYYLRDIYLAWVEDGYDDPRNNFEKFNDGFRDRREPSYVADANNHTTREGEHLVFAHLPTDGDPTDTWFEYGKEITLDVSGSNLINCTNHQLHFAVFGPSAIEVVDYSEFAENYKPGMTYQLMFNKKTTYEYWIPQGEAIEIEEPQSPEILDTSASSDAPKIVESTPVISTSNIGVPEIKTEVALNTNPENTSEVSQNITSDTVQDAIPDTTSFISETPNAVEVPLAASREEEHQFPWWLIIFIFSGIVLVLWWFVPIGRRREDEEEQ